MEMYENDSSVSEFILLGLTNDPELQVPLFVIFLQVYIITLFSNIAIIILIMISPQLKNPMYFLLANLSFVDVCNSSIIIPNMLFTFLSKRTVISFSECLSQLFFFVLFGNMDGLLLAAMAYDRYYAICNPLYYSVIITKSVCILLAAGTYALGLLISSVVTGGMSRLNFCGPNKISHFYCDAPPLFKLSCSDTTINQIAIFAVAGTLQVGTLLVVVVSYIYIITAIIRIHSSQGRLKAFSTCSSHFVCVTLFYCPAFFMYLRPNSSYDKGQGKVASLFYTVFVPMLNPLIYSLRNKTMLKAIRYATRKNLALP